MTKEEILELIDSTIQPNEQKGITASTLQNVLKEMAQSSGGGSDSGSGSDGVLYIKESSSGELSEEDRAINAATFAKLKAGGSYTVYLDYDGLFIPISYGVSTLEDGTCDIAILAEGYLMNMMGLYASIATLLEDGSTRSDLYIPNPGKVVTTGELIANIEGYIMYSQMFGMPYHFYLNTVASPLLSIPAELFGDNATIFIKLTDPKQTSLYALDSTTGNLELYFIISGGTLYLDADDDSEKNNNKMILESLTDVGNVKFNCMTGVSTIGGGKVYNPVSIDQTNKQVTIYNGAYVTYTINSDGTCTVQS